MHVGSRPLARRRAGDEDPRPRRHHQRVVGGLVSSKGTYSAEKAWVRYFSEGLARELAGSGVTCTALCPGFTHTEFHERGRMNMSRLPEFMWLDAAAVARQGLDDAAKGKIVSVPGVQYKTLVGVMNAVPRVLVRDVSSVIARRRRTQGS